MTSRSSLCSARVRARSAARLSVLALAALCSFEGGIALASSSQPGSPGSRCEASVPAVGPSIRDTAGMARPAPGPFGRHRMICLRVDFPDLQFQESSTLEEHQAVARAVEAYYRDLSGGLHDLRIDVSAEVFRAPEAMSEYVQRPEGGSSDDSERPPREQLLADAVESADASILFSDYDSLCVVHAGLGAEERDVPEDSNIWSARMGLAVATRSDDRALIGGGMIVPERYTAGVDRIVGVWCHEYGHELGLPDLYDTDGDAEGIGRWGLMASGNWLDEGRAPRRMSGWSLVRLGWARALDLDTEGHGYLPNVAAEAIVGRIPLDSAGATGEHLLLEVRRKTGQDRALPGEGLLVYHVDPAVALIVDAGRDRTRFRSNRLQVRHAPRAGRDHRLPVAQQPETARARRRDLRLRGCRVPPSGR